MSDAPSIDMWFAWAPRLIKPVRVERVTSAFVWTTHVPGAIASKRARFSSGAGYFDTWAEAHAFLTRHADARLAAARQELQRCQAVVGNVRGMLRRPVEAQSSSPSTDS